ncbi:MAG TPA: dATP/dGTP diphosphohydrolase domain-containing protein [bacterium]|nr:dATP/dGTP diphosphohydrolase domain-containing protein [bacterium]
MEAKLEKLTRMSPELEAEVKAVPRGQGEKFDAGKIDLLTLFTYFPRALAAVATVSEYGLRKYASSNATGSGWQKVPDGMRRYGAALLRHLRLQAKGEDYDDQDSGLAHSAQVAWNALAVLELALRDEVIANRRGNEIEMRDGKPYPVLHTTKVIDV